MVEIPPRTVEQLKAKDSVDEMKTARRGLIRVITQAKVSCPTLEIN
jgi:hypothetical protein